MDQAEEKYPIVFSKEYDIKFGGLEKLHVFDSCKWGKIVEYLIEKTKKFNTDSGVSINITMNRIHQANYATEQQLKVGHSKDYLDSLKWSVNVARIVEIFIVSILCNCIVKKFLLLPFRYQVGGTVLATRLALEKQWAINVGGGFHHASENCGGGFCVYADISIAIKTIMIENSSYKFLIVDLDAHQGNGHERDFKDYDNVFIFDMFNAAIYPHDREAKKRIDIAVPLISFTKDEEYLDLLQTNLNKCFSQFQPNLLVYNAGTDCLQGDPLGSLNITPHGIIKRDEMVFTKAKEEQCPIVMVTSGGYQMSNAEIIADSILNLFRKDIIQ